MPRNPQDVDRLLDELASTAPSAPRQPNSSPAGVAPAAADPSQASTTVMKLGAIESALQAQAEGAPHSVGMASRGAAAPPPLPGGNAGAATSAPAVDDRMRAAEEKIKQATLARARKQAEERARRDQEAKLAAQAQAQQQARAAAAREAAARAQAESQAKRDAEAQASSPVIATALAGARPAAGIVEVTQALPSLAKAGTRRASGSVNIRTSPRLPIVARVTRYDGKPAYWKSVDLSAGGVFLTGTPVLNQGDEMELGLWLPDAGTSHEIICQAKVAWTNHPDAPKKPDLPFGMGMEFVSLDDDDRIFLDDYLSRVQPEPEQPVPAAAPPPAPAAAHGVAAGAGGIDSMISDVIDVDMELEEEPVIDAAALAKDKLVPGSLVRSYRIMRLLGAGGMGEVYLAEHVQLGRKVAIKRLHSRYISDETLVNRFFDEARGVSQIIHDNIVAITDFISEGNNKCYVMEHLDGETLTARLNRGGAFPLPRMVHVARQICDALQAVHSSGIIHRDLKPDNIILIERNGTRDFVKLLDFGIAKFVQQNEGMKGEPTAAGLTLGTPGYIAPEYVLGNGIDYRADLYALGVLMYQMVTGTRPFVAESWPQMLMKHAYEATPKPSAIANIPAPLERLILQCLEKEPEKRPQTAAEIERRLAGMIDDATGVVGSPRRRLLVPIAAAAAVGFAVAGLGVWFATSGTTTQSSTLTGSADTAAIPEGEMPAAPELTPPGAPPAAAPTTGAPTAAPAPRVAAPAAAAPPARAAPEAAVPTTKRIRKARPKKAKPSADPFFDAPAKNADADSFFDQFD